MTITILKWVLLLPTVIAVNILIRVPIVWVFTNALSLILRDEGLDIRYSWLPIALVGFRDYLATLATLYIGLKLVDERKKIAFYVSIAISIIIVILVTINYPIRFGEIGLWNSVAELALLAAQCFGVYKAIKSIREEFYYDIHNI